MEFSLTGGTKAFKATLPSVPVQNGVFNLVLDSNLTNEADAWLPSPSKCSLPSTPPSTSR